MTANDPIVAVATAAGRGAVGIVRISAPGSLARLLPAVFSREPQPRVATLGAVVDEQGQSIDEALAIHFPAPQSYTGETVLELQVHGGPVVLQLVLARCLQAAAGLASDGRPRLAGLRLARPGEFTERAYLNGRLDLAQAEAVADLIDAGTEAAARSATRSLQGVFSKRIGAFREELEDLRVLVESTLDFPEEEIDFIRAADCDGRVAALRQALADVLVAARQGQLLRDGLTVALVGQPNVGKSSLLNALAGAELAIVTPVPGTTRDRVRETIQIHGIPLHIIDTAGLRETEDPVERIGVARSWASVAEADVVVVVHDLARAGDAADPDYAAAQLAIEARLEAEPIRGTRLDVGNKLDLLMQQSAPQQGQRKVLPLSAATDEGLDDLRSALAEAAGWQAQPEGLFTARERHLEALRAAQEPLATAAARLSQPHPALDLLAEDLRLAHRALGSITGHTDADALLGMIFSRFCIGK